MKQPKSKSLAEGLLESFEPRNSEKMLRFNSLIAQAKSDAETLHKTLIDLAKKALDPEGERPNFIILILQYFESEHADDAILDIADKAFPDEKLEEDKTKDHPHYKDSLLIKVILSFSKRNKSPRARQIKARIESHLGGTPFGARLSKLQLIGDSQK